MQVESGSVVTITYDIANEAGEIIESSDLSGPVSFVVGKGSIIKGLDSKIVGMTAGDEADLSFPPEEAFGRVEDSPRRKIPRNEFPGDPPPKVGDKFGAGLPGSGGQRITLEILEVGDEEVEVRMVHPLAGQTIGMSVKIVAVRAATAVEKETGRISSRPPPPPSKK